MSTVKNNIKRMKIPKSIYAVKSNIMFVVGLSLFALLFVIIYTPFYGADHQLNGASSSQLIPLWYSNKALCMSICCAIILVSTALSRTLLLLTTRTARLRESEYFLWQLAEVIVTALFCDLFLSLYLHIGFIEHIPTVLLIYITIAVYPYAFYWLLIERIDRDLRIANAQRTIVELRQGTDRLAAGAIRFVDDKGNVKLVVSSDRVISIEAAGNYVNILYENNGVLTRYGLRNTLKGVEEICENNALIRCHRSYYINLHKVKLLRKETDGMFAEIEADGVEDIPISKSYAHNVMQRFSEIVHQ